MLLRNIITKYEREFADFFLDGALAYTIQYKDDNMQMTVYRSGLAYKFIKYDSIFVWYNNIELYSFIGKKEYDFNSKD